MFCFLWMPYAQGRGIRDRQKVEALKQVYYLPSKNLGVQPAPNIISTCMVFFRIRNSIKLSSRSKHGRGD